MVHMSIWTKLRYLLPLILIFLLSHTAFAQTADEIRAKIQQTAQDKAKLEQEIAQYEIQLKDIGKQASTLASAIASLDTTIKKNALDIKLAQNNIDSTELQIKSLAFGISKDIDLIDQDDKAIAELIVESNKAGNLTFIENLLAYKNISEFFNQEESRYKIQNKIRGVVEQTRDTKKQLEDNKILAEKKRKELVSLKSDLLDRKAVLDVAKKEKAKLLLDTKNKQSNYEKILAEKKALSAAFDKELLQFESDLKFTINPNSYPSAGLGILSWPLDVIKITQKFGVTDFSKTTNAYNGQGHNGVDFGAPIGTRIKAALSGTVVGTGDTDLVCPGASFGRWVFIQHANGLSTIYAHLSLIKVKTGDKVITGDIIGYTGLTGFTTGPHLHFGVYATQGVKIMSRKSTVCGGTYTMPVASLNAYLDPLQYL